MEFQSLTFIYFNFQQQQQMCQIILPGMKERKRGLIMNLSSMSALRPVPYIAVYGSTKALVDYFSRALAIECADCGIEVQVGELSLVGESCW